MMRLKLPRMPCAKLSIRFNRPDMVKLFWKSARSGVYFAVEQPGVICAGDDVRIVERDPRNVSVADVISLYTGETAQPELFKRFMAAPIGGKWKEGIRERWANN